MIEKKCENCGYYHKINDEDLCNCMGGSHYERPCVENNLMFFRPSEKAIREDEKEKIIKRLEEKFNDLVCSDLFQNEAYAIEDIINELKEK